MNDKRNILGSLMQPRQQMRSDEKDNMASVGNIDAIERRNSKQHRPTSGASSGGNTSRQHKLRQRFTVIRKLGKGTYGKVQLAINKETGQEVAIKTIKKTKIENEQDLQRVRREIQIMSSIEHPHIIHIYEVFENKDKIVLVMQYAPGGELYEYVSQSKLLDDSEARRLFRQIATAIYYCHQNKICHRDLKLENILLDEKNNAKLADFGLSNVFDKRRQLKTFCGSPLYASPEIVQGSPYEGPEVDCWSLGVLLYTLVYGAMPFDGSNFKRLVKQISESCYFEPKQKSLASPLIKRLLCADPAKRANILDICSDPWVNGTTLGSPTSPGRMSPTCNSSQQPHNSLLKVAQDMAKLTPVRFDILLALTPSSPAITTKAPENSETIQKEKENIMAKGEMRGGGIKMAPTRRSTLTLDPSIMEVDETRSTSPVGSYILRDLHESQQQQDKNEYNLECERIDLEAKDSVEQKTQQEIIVETDEIAKHPDMMFEEEQEQQEQQQQQVASAENSQADIEMILNAGDDHSKCTVEPVTTAEIEKMTIDGQVIETDKLVEKTENQTDEGNNSNKNNVIKMEDSGEEAKVCIQNEEVKMEVETQRQAEVQEAIIQEDKTSGVDNNSELNQNEPNGVGDVVVNEKEVSGPKEKPKKVKKKIIIVRKKKKVSKKDVLGSEVENKEKDEARLDKENKGTDENGQHESGSADAAGHHMNSPEQLSEQHQTKVSQKSRGPGKVRIPNTFQASTMDNNGSTGQQTQQPAPGSKGVQEGRRRSALVADVSQKLLQQQQHSASASSALIWSDQPQLSSVRVSDKKSEFERRASLASTNLAAAAAAATTISQPVNKGSQSQSSVKEEKEEIEIEIEREGQEKKEEPKKVEAVLESFISILNPTEQTTIMEPVDKQEALEVTPAPVLDKRVLLLNEPAKKADFSYEDETMEYYEGADIQRKSPEWTESNQKSRTSLDVATICHDRSSSVETIIQSPVEEAPLNIRSSLNINLAPKVEQEDEKFELPVAKTATGNSDKTSSSSQVALGPTPIARSYKKVTFTKDGACITETGKIYSTQADDGTMRRVERKSKITHYPANDNNGEISSPAEYNKAIGKSEEIQKKIVYDNDGVARQIWQESQLFQSSSQSKANNTRKPQFEKLIIPSQGYSFKHPMNSYNDEQENDDIDNDFIRSRNSPFSRQSYLQSQLGRTDSASSCSSGSTDVFDDIFDTWTGAISMFNQNSGQFMGPQLQNYSFKNHHRHVFPSIDPFDQQSIFSASPGGSRNHRHHHANRGSSSLAGTPRCESAEPWQNSQPHSFKVGGDMGHGRRPKDSSARGWIGESSGYDSDAPLERRPASALGSARGTFGSSNLFSTTSSAHRKQRQMHSFFEAPEFMTDFEPIGNQMDPFGGDLMRNIEHEHESLKQRLAQQHKQLWKGSTPSLFTDSDLNHRISAEMDAGQVHRGPQTRRRHHGLWQYLRPNESLDNQHQQRYQPPRPLSSSGSQCGSEQMHKQQQQPPWPQQHLPPSKASEQNLEQSQSSSSFLRQSIALDTAPTRKNTANLADHLPPRQFQPMRRSISKTSLMTSQLANMQINTGSRGKQVASEKQQVASFIELKRTSSSSDAQHQAVQQQHQRQTVTSTNRVVSTSGSLSAFGDNIIRPSSLSTDSMEPSQRNERIDSNCTIQDNAEAAFESDSRIHNWLQESEANLSNSFESKSSASDTMVQHDNSKNDSFSNLYGSLRPKRENILSSQYQSQHHQSGSSSALGQSNGPLAFQPQTDNRATSQTLGRNANNRMNHSTSATILLSSSSSSSIRNKSTISESEYAKQATMEQQEVLQSCRQIQRDLTDSGVVMGSTMGDHLSKTSSSNKVSKTSFTLRHRSPIMDDDCCGSNSESNLVKQVVKQQHHQSQQHQMSNSSSFSRVSSSTAPVNTNMDGLHWIKTIESNSRLFGDDLEDSLSGGASGDLESRESSSSLLEQLRSRGYRSMINQRIVSQSAEQQQQTVQSSVINTSVSSSLAATTTSSSVVESSSSRVITGSGESSSSTASTSGTRVSHQIYKNSIKESSCKEEQEDQSQTQYKGNINETVVDPLAIESQHERILLANCKIEPVDSDLTPRNAEFQQVNNGKQDGAHEVVVDKDEDEDVREAKANIKAYVDRMKETEMFIKSIQQEEENLERQRQQLFLFNNLMLNTKLNGIRGNQVREDWVAMNKINESDLQETAQIITPESLIATRSAPISNYNSNSSISEQTSRFFPSAAFSFKPTYKVTSFQLPASNCIPRRLQTTVIEQSLNVPNYSEMTSYQPIATTIQGYQGPLEKIEPLSTHHEPMCLPSASYRPSFRRSKSQLGDQFKDFKRRPLSACIYERKSDESSPYFSLRTKRSLSQIRYPVSQVNRFSQPPTGCMMREYKSAYGKLSSELIGGSSERIDSQVNHEARLGQDAGETDESDDGMSAYRASAYVAKIVPKEVPARGRDFQRRSSYNEPNCTAAFSKDHEPPSSYKRNSIRFGDERRERRTSLRDFNSCQAISAEIGNNKATTNNNSNSTSASPYRRRLSLAATGELVAAPIMTSNKSSEKSRLSELEQRIQENKKRREELLSGKLSPEPMRKSRSLSQSSANEQPSKVVLSAVSTASLSTGPKFNRPTRLESMEARIKRKSYCVRMGDCSPERTQLRSHKSLEKKWDQSMSNQARASVLVRASGSPRNSVSTFDSSRSSRRDSASSCGTYEKTCQRNRSKEPNP